MAQSWLDYTQIIATRLYRPFRPLVQLLLIPLTLSLLLLVVLGLMIFGQLAPVNPDYALQEQAAWQPWKAQAEFVGLGAEIASWEKILQEMPYHREVLMRLAVLYERIYEAEKAQEYFEKAQYLDPLISPLPSPRVSSLP